MMKGKRMRKHLVLLALLILSVVVTAGCALRLYNSPASLPTATTVSSLPTSLPTLASLATPTVVTPGSLPTTSVPPTSAILPSITPSTLATQISPADFCADPQARILINNFKAALQASNATLFAPLVSPLHGMDARLYRNGRVVNYDAQHAQFLFDSTYVVDWGAAPGSGLETKSSFHQVILPALLKVFNKDTTLDCDQVQIGGATYKAAWPYTGVNFYSVYFPGTPGNGNLDWRTWLVGIEYVNGKPYLYAILQFFWEP
jgi:hypothetical protein